MRLFFSIICILSIPFNSIFAQNNDCIDAVVICDNNQISYNPSGPGLDDFFSSSNDNGCLTGYEHQSAWYYFEFRSDMPNNSVIEFTIDPNAGPGEDYDFAIYGPNPSCDDLGAPIRCSFASGACASCPQTGLGNGATDYSEPASGSGYVAALTVQPGEGFYLLVDNYDSSSAGFDLDWGGSAASFLNCEASPECNIELSQSGPIELCPSAPQLNLPFSISGTEGAETYAWTASNGGVAFLSATNIANPNLNIPQNASGSYVYTLTVTEGTCEKTIDIIVNITAPFTVNITGGTLACEGEEITLSVAGNYSGYQWSSGESSQSITVTESGNFSVAVVDAQNCTGGQSIDVAFNPLPEPQITGDNNICEGESTFFDAGSGYVSYIWSNEGSSQNINISNADSYAVTVTDANGCEGFDTRSLQVFPAPVVQIQGDDIICKGNNTVLDAGSGLSTYLWNTGAESSSITVEEAGFYEVMVTDQNACSSSSSFVVALSEIELEFTQTEPLCFGDDDGFIRIDLAKGGAAPYQFSWEGEPYSSKNFISSLAPGNYNLHVLDAADCEIEQNFTVLEGFDLLIDLGEDQLLKLGDETSITAVLNISDDEIANISWTPAATFDCLDCLEHDLIPYETMSVSATVIDERGCTASHEITIIVDKEREVFIPNAFSPNDDGVNDVLTIYSGKDVEQINSFLIFNRWGNPVFEQKDFQANDNAYGWNGRLRKDLNSGTFIYTAEVLFIDGSTKRFSGEVILVR